MQVSRAFAELARNCIVVINSSSRIQVPLAYLTRFRNLQAVGDQIIVTVQSDDLGLLSMLPALRSINLYVAILPGDDEIQVLEAIAQGIHLDAKVPQLNLRVAYGLRSQVVCWFIQGDRFINYPNTFSNVVLAFRQAHPELREVMRSSPNIYLTPRSMQDFIRTENFGLLDPSRPPSETNIPLSLPICSVWPTQAPSVEIYSRFYS